MKVCSTFCGKYADDPACRTCRLAVLADHSGTVSGIEKFHRLLRDVRSELLFYRKEVSESTELPFSWRVHSAREELFEAIKAMDSWAERHLEDIEKGAA
jgi:hypothetical protein